MAIIDELMLGKNKNYGEVSGIYQQLANNYRSRNQFDAASHFFIGDMETKRKALLNGDAANRLRSINYSFFNYLSLYGQSAVLPLFVWTPVFIIVFTLLRSIFGICFIHPDLGCNFESKLIDSIAALLQSPRSSPNNDFDIIERITSLPLIGLGLRNALKTIFGVFG
jgi:hypothetical protein